MKNIYIGYDTREDIAYQVSKFSLTNKSKDIEVHPLKLTELRDKQLYWRDEDKLGSTEFTFSRFLVPELNNFKVGLCFVIVIFYLWRMLTICLL